MKRAWLHALIVSSLVMVACGRKHDSDGSGGNLTVQIVEPHDQSTHFAGDVDFRADARVSLAGQQVGPDAEFTWEIRHATQGQIAAFQGAAQTLSLSELGAYTVIVHVQDPELGSGSASATFQLGNTVAEIRNPDPFEVQPVGDAFTLQGYAETRTPGETLDALTFRATEISSGSVAFMQTVTPPPNSTTFTGNVQPSLAAGNYTLELTATTTNPDDAGLDTITVYINNPPEVAIVAPATGSQVAPGSDVDFEATATDPEGGPVTVQWTSSVEGSLGTELTFTRSDLARAKHTILVTATDDMGLTATASTDLYIEDPGTPLFVAANSLPGQADVQDLAVENGSPDLIWAALDGDGAVSVAADTGDGTAYGNPGGSTPNFTSALVVADGRRLFGTRGDGVAVLDAGAGPAYLTSQDVAVDADVFSLAEGSGDEIWIGTAAGVTRVTSAFGNASDFTNGGLDNTIFALHTDGNGNAWAATDGEGLILINGATGSTTALRRDDGLADNTVFGVELDADSVWAATDGGLSNYAPDATPAMVSWDGDSGLPADSIRDVVRDADGIVWLATNNGGVRFDPATGLSTVFQTPDLATNNVTSVAVDSNGAVWFGCAATNGGNGTNGGIVRYDGD